LTHAHGKEHPYIAAAQVNIGAVYYMTHRHEEALGYYQRALSTFVNTLGPDHPHVAYALTGLGDCYLVAGELDKAIEHLERALRIREQTGAGVWSMAETRFALAEALWDAGRNRKRAIELARKARDGYAAEGEKAAKDLSIVEGWLEEYDRRR
jgi:tetratricopeptide (TPR) repeat protein